MTTCHSHAWSPDHLRLQQLDFHFLLYLPVSFKFSFFYLGAIIFFIRNSEILHSPIPGWKRDLMLVSCTAFSACECEFSVVIEIIHFAGASLRRFIFIYICCVLLIFVLSVNGPKLPKIVSLHAAFGVQVIRFSTSFDSGYVNHKSRLPWDHNKFYLESSCESFALIAVFALRCSFVFFDTTSFLALLRSAWVSPFVEFSFDLSCPHDHLAPIRLAIIVWCSQLLGNAKMMCPHWYVPTCLAPRGGERS